MRVRIISYEDVNAWILGKFARKLNEELVKLGVDSDISGSADPAADINHHIIYLGYSPTTGNQSDSLMVTHIDDFRKLNLLKKQLQVARVGICMSKPLMNDLITGGILAEKLCYINPAHDGVITVKPYIIGITSQVKPDGCKREHLLAQLSEHISPQLFRFKIMGSGWESIISAMQKKGFEVTYFSDFNYEEYVNLIPSLDYYLYMGQDEGSMGTIDALAAGVKTIVTPQGFHLDAERGITHPFNSLEDLIAVFKSLAAERSMLVHSVSSWTWSDYAIKHLEVWKYLINPNTESAEINGKYNDGLFSLLNKDQLNREKKLLNYRVALYKGAWKRTWYKIRVGFSDFESFKKKSKSFIRNLTK
ncbi:MAG: hypothetical protein IPK96_14035 [Flammeovirgaceae bacterium]|nr:hypothetical protein [Flammeovirgaceae bacterium]